MKTVLIIAAILFVVYLPFVSCKKTNTNLPNTLSGIVVHYPSRQPAPGEKVYLKIQGLTLIEPDTSTYWSIYYLDTLIPPPYYLLDSTITDANGKFSLPIPTSCQGNACYGVYFAIVIKPNKIMVYLVPPFGQSSDTLFIDQPSYFKLNMHKNTPASLIDTVFENRYYLSENNTPFFPTAFRKVQTGQSNATIIDTFSYNLCSKVAVEWRHYKNGLIASGIDTINLIPNSTTELNVNY